MQESNECRKKTRMRKSKGKGKEGVGPKGPTCSPSASVDPSPWWRLTFRGSQPFDLLDEAQTSSTESYPDRLKVTLGFTLL